MHFLTLRPGRDMDQSSSFSKLLKTNYAPTNREAEQIKIFLDTQRNLLDNLDDEIDILLDPRDALARSVEEYWALLSRRVPSDILLSIFEDACLNSDCRVNAPHVLPPLERVHRKCPSVDLSHVCQEWRALSLGHPFL